jgi:lipoyl(octanoyl) transferase
MPEEVHSSLQVRLLGRVPYQEALAVQEGLVTSRKAGEIPDQLLLLEHPHVITMGSSSQEENLLFSAEERSRRGIELHEVGRGGDVTYHGPGQLVGYPILDLKPDRKDLHRYLRDLEEVLILTLSHFGITSGREEGHTGVWVPEGKLAAIGVRVSSGWITSHGFALNVDPEMEYFSSIIPCGIHDRSVASLSQLLGVPVTMEEVIPRLVKSFEEVFNRMAIVA